MNGWQHFTFGSLPVSMWRNGGGETREIMSNPSGKFDFDWRVSIAAISQDSAFSVFPGIDRSIILLSGDGVYLRALPDIDHALTAIGEPFTFRGEIAPSAYLAGGVTTDFNVMTRRAICVSRVIAVRKSLCITHQQGGVIYVVRGDWQMPNGLVIGAGEGFAWSVPLTDEYDAGHSIVMAKNDDNLLLWTSIKKQNYR